MRASAPTLDQVRILFAGTPDVALPSLRAITDAGHEVVAVLTRPDAPAGRGKKLTCSPVAQLAAELGLPSIKATRADDELRALVTALRPEVAAVVAFGILLPQSLLDAVPGGWINLHFSLLPRWRGAAPVQRAILAGDACTGATTFRIVQELDAGPIYRRLTVPIEEHETSGQLLGRLAELGAGLLLNSLSDIEAGRQPSPQPTDGITLAPKIHPNDVRIDWTSNHEQIDRLVRAANPVPGAWTMLAGERFQVLRVGPSQRQPALAPGELAADRRSVWVGTGSTNLELLEVKAFGRKPMSGADWARGRQGGLERGLCFHG